jgi:hypothetical protein
MERRGFYPLALEGPFGLIHEIAGQEIARVGQDDLCYIIITGKGQSGYYR